MVYQDYNVTSLLDERVAKAMIPTRADSKHSNEASLRSRQKNKIEKIASQISKDAKTEIASQDPDEPIGVQGTK